MLLALMADETDNPGPLRRLGADTDARAVIVTGAGSAFSAGGDLREMLEMLRAWFARWGRKLGLKTERRMRAR